MRKIFNRSGWIYFGFFVGSILLQIPLLVLIQKIGRVEFSKTTEALLVSSISMYGIFFGLSALCFRMLPKGGGIENERWSLGKKILYFIVCLSMMYLGNIFGNVLMFVTGILTGKGMPTNDTINIMLDASVWSVFLSTVVLAPIVEEWMFRKFLLDRIARYGQGLAAVVSAVLFGLAHGNFYQFFYAFGLGLLLSYVYMKTGKIRYSIIYHMAMNFMGGIIAPALLKWQLAGASSPYLLDQFLPSMFTIAYGFLMLGCMITGIVLFFCNIKGITLRAAEETVPRSTVWKACFLSPGIWAFVLFCLIQFGQSLVY